MLQSSLNLINWKTTENNYLYFLEAQKDCLFSKS